MDKTVDFATYILNTIFKIVKKGINTEGIHALI